MSIENSRNNYQRKVEWSSVRIRKCLTAKRQKCLFPLLVASTIKLRPLPPLCSHILPPFPDPHRHCHYPAPLHRVYHHSIHFSVTLVFLPPFFFLISITFVITSTFSFRLFSRLFLAVPFLIATISTPLSPGNRAQALLNLSYFPLTPHPHLFFSFLHSRPRWRTMRLFVLL